jgi:hypothetical protein
MQVMYKVVLVFNNFIRWWDETCNNDEYDWGDVPESSEGDWLYKTGKDKMEYLELGPWKDLAFLVSHFYPRVHAVYRRVYILLCCCCCCWGGH